MTDFFNALLQFLFLLMVAPLMAYWAIAAISPVIVFILLPVLVPVLILWLLFKWFSRW